jgi:ATP-dependent Clp protease ATP-binding subunit ClpA
VLQTSVVLDPAEIGSQAKRLATGLQSLVVGQDEAIEHIVNVYQTYLTGFATPGRPIGNFLFLGPTGTGKTRLVEATAECPLDNPRAVIKIDCAEFQHSHEIAKLVRSPPGYLGHRETHALLSQEALNQFHTDAVKISFVLFDEIEKANDTLWNLLLGILDKATLTLRDDRKVDFSRALIFMTSNLGASEMGALLNPRFGFIADEQRARYEQGPAGVNLKQKIAVSGAAAARRRFTPEFINSLDRIVTFNPLGTEQLSRALEIELGLLQQRIITALPDPPFKLELTERARELLLREGTD